MVRGVRDRLNHRLGLHLLHGLVLQLCALCCLHELPLEAEHLIFLAGVLGLGGGQLPGQRRVVGVRACGYGAEL